jgi:hypothetical protein
MTTTETEIKEQLERLERESSPFDFEPALRSFLAGRPGSGAIETELGALLEQVQRLSDREAKRRCERLIERLVEVETEVTVHL